MRRGQKSQSRVKHQRSVGRYNSPYQRGGTSFSPMNPWVMTSYKPYGLDPLRLRQLRKKANRRAKQKGGRVHKVTYPWTTKGRQYKRRRRRH